MSSKKSNEPIVNPGPLDLVKHRWLYLSLSLIFMLPGLFFLVQNMMNPDIKAPVRLGIDFTGGTLLEYGFKEKVTLDDLDTIRAVFDAKGYTGSIIQIQDPIIGINAETEQDATSQTTATPAESETTFAKADVIDTKTETALGEKKVASGTTVSSDATADPVVDSVVDPAEALTSATVASDNNVSTIVSIRSKHLTEADATAVKAELEEKFGGLTLLQKYSIGPSLASELLTNGLIALVLAYVLIVGYLTYRFEFDFAVCAIIALIHDALFVFGAFAMLGVFFQTEVNSMFVTAILTVVGFSVHDTIVVYDRLRENYRIYYTKKVPFTTIVNISVNQTLARSINTSVSTLLTLFALYFFGGDTTKDFVFAAIVGIIVGTYSSISIASLLLAWWRGRFEDEPATSSGNVVTA